MKMISGIPTSKGIGIGIAVVLGQNENFSKFIGQKITSTEIENNLERFDMARKATSAYIEKTKVKASEVLGDKEAQMFKAYKMLLDDPILNDMVLKNMKIQLLCAEAAVIEAVDKIKAMFLAINNEYMKQRAEDVENVGKYIINALQGIESIDLSHLGIDSILIAKDLTPADTVALDKKHIKGFATQKGGKTSHTAIVARTLEIPALVGCGESILEITSGDLVIIDGELGVLMLNPGKEELEEYSLKQKRYLEISEDEKMLKNELAQTLDGRCVELVGNITVPEEAINVLDKGGDGVGLFRTEFLYLDRSELPTEEEQFKAYKKAAETLGTKPCIIRTMDIGGDKRMSNLGIAIEDNPFLGYRAIRICLKEVEVFKTQLRAILRASAYGNLKIMFPMISGLEELRAAKKIFEEVKTEAGERGIQFNENIKVGIMIEIPSAAMIADLLAKEVDFFSIGTNDLCQYTLAVDRMNEKISYLYNPLHLGVLRLIKNIIDSGHNAGIKVGMCGEMASEVENAVILLGLELDEFSMVPSGIPAIKNMIRKISFSKAKEIADNVMKMENAAEISAYIKEKFYVN